MEALTYPTKNPRWTFFHSSKQLFRFFYFMIYAALKYFFHKDLVIFLVVRLLLLFNLCELVNISTHIKDLLIRLLSILNLFFQFIYKIIACVWLMMIIYFIITTATKTLTNTTELIWRSILPSFAVPIFKALYQPLR